MPQYEILNFDLKKIPCTLFIQLITYKQSRNYLNSLHIYVNQNKSCWINVRLDKFDCVFIWFFVRICSH